jgi:tRNA nucleotidyltransferase (CCA-adding enzyme)
MAKDPETGALVDPFHGRKDLEEGVLRHVSDAFAEDPVRILRVARFAARFGFKVHEETMQLMRRMVDSGEAAFLVPERVWQEFAKGLMEKHPERMLEVLAETGLQQSLLPGVDLGRKRYEGSLAVRYALLAWPLDADAVRRMNAALKAPNSVDDIADITARYRPFFAQTRPGAEKVLEFLKGADAFRRPERFGEVLQAARLAVPSFDAARVDAALRAAGSIDAAAIAKSSAGADVGRAIDAARLEALKKLDG